MAIPLTAGSSGAIAAVILAGGVATGIQCANGLGRLSLIAMNHDDYVAWMDSREWYTATNTAGCDFSCRGCCGFKSAALTYRLLNRSSSESLLSLLQNEPGRPYAINRGDYSYPQSRHLEFRCKSSNEGRRVSQTLSVRSVAVALTA